MNRHKQEESCFCSQWWSTILPTPVHGGKINRKLMKHAQCSTFQERWNTGSHTVTKKLSVECTHHFGTIWCAYGCMGSKLCLILWFCWEDWDLLHPEKNSSMSKWVCWRKTDWTSSTRLGFCGVDPSLPKKLICLRLYGIKLCHVLWFCGEEWDRLRSQNEFWNDHLDSYTTTNERLRQVEGRWNG
jgi:hypothetical protein